MSSRKTSVFVVMSLTTLWALSAMGVFAQAQDDAEKSAAKSSGRQVKKTVTTTTQSTDAVIENGQPDLPSPAPVPMLPGTGTNSMQIKIQGAMQKFLESHDKALREYDKALKEFDKALREFEKNPEAKVPLQKAQEAMQKARDVYEKARKDLDKGPKGSFAISGSDGDVFGGGYGGSFSSGGYSSSSRRWDPENGSVIVRSSGNSETIEVINSPEAKALHEKEQNLVDEIGGIEKQYRSNKDKDARAELKKKVEELVSEQFNIRQEYRELQVKQLEKELARIRDTIQKRTESREQIIKRRIAQLLHEQDDLEF